MPLDEAIAPPNPVGILLAAGRGRRFDGTGAHDKLLARLPCGNPVAIVAARKLLASVSRVVAVVRPDNAPLSLALKESGCNVIVCSNADEGMGTVLSFAVRHCAEASGWVVALADMPFIDAASYRAVIDGLSQSALVAPVFSGQRGHPVVIGRPHLAHLLALHGDIGPRALFALGTPHLVRVNDPGVIRDIDTPDDL